MASTIAYFIVYRRKKNGTQTTSDIQVVSANVSGGGGGGGTVTLTALTLKTGWLNNNVATPYTSANDTLDRNLDSQFINQDGTIYYNSSNKAFSDSQGLQAIVNKFYFDETTGEVVIVDASGNLTRWSDVGTIPNTIDIQIAESFN